jgi:hypothetical protein
MDGRRRLGEVTFSVPGARLRLGRRAAAEWVPLERRGPAGRSLFRRNVGGEAASVAVGKILVQVRRRRPLRNNKHKMQLQAFLSLLELRRSIVHVWARSCCRSVGFRAARVALACAASPRARTSAALPHASVHAACR